MLLAAAPKLMAQATPQAPATDAAEETITLDPFSVTAAGEEDGYTVKDTLAGTRIRTDLRDVASALTVVNAQFLRDTGATSNTDLLVYTPNTEVSGVGGNFAGVGSVYMSGTTEKDSLARPSQNTRVRGLDSADSTRDFFSSYIPWDSYNVDRVDLQRGPNSILFGVGSPAGIVNTSLNGAGFKNAGKAEARIGSFGSFRLSGDYNLVLKKNELAFRVAMLNDKEQYRQKPAFEDDRRIFAAMRWDPKLFGEGNKTTIKANFENGRINANRPRILPPGDNISRFFSSGTDANGNPNGAGLNRQLVDVWDAWDRGLVQTNTGQIKGNNDTAAWSLPWVGQYMVSGAQLTANPVLMFNGGSATTPSIIRQISPTTLGGLDSTGKVTGGIDGLPFGSAAGIKGYADYAYRNLEGGDLGLFKDVLMSDSSIFDFYNNLIDGPTKYERNNWNAYNVSLEQFFLNNRLGMQVVFDKQSYYDEQARNLDGLPVISVDIMKYTLDVPYAYNKAKDLGLNPGITTSVNPNAGKAVTGSGVKNGGRSFRNNTESWRATLTGEVRATDVLDKGIVTDLLGRHVLTGLYQHDKVKTDARTWARYAVDSSYAQALNDNTQASLVTSNGRILDMITYLSDASVASATSASGLNLKGITANQTANMANIDVRYFNSNWNYAKNVSPGATWNNYGSWKYYKNPQVPSDYASTQSENPANYMGWTTSNFSILNGDVLADRKQLNTSVVQGVRVLDSKAITYQGYLFDEMLVPSIGVRRDVVSDKGAVADIKNKPYADEDNMIRETGKDSVSKGNNTSWGAVLHLPKKLRGKLPLGSDISLSYNRGKNMRVENRYGFSGARLPNASGDTTDIGVVVSVLDEKVMLKVNRYKTTARNANIASQPGEAATLGGQSYMLTRLEGWGAATSLMNKAGNTNQFPGWEWFWNWALVDSGWDSAYNDPTTALYNNHPSTIKQKAATADWFATVKDVTPQSWFDAYGFAVNADKLAAGDLTAIQGWAPGNGVGGVQPSGAGAIGGIYPIGTIDVESKGWEYELVATPIKGLRLSLNASKTEAKTIGIGKEMSAFIEKQWARLGGDRDRAGNTYAAGKSFADTYNAENGTNFTGKAGDLRLWWGGGGPFREAYRGTIWAPYTFQLDKASSGLSTGELAPWKINAIASYSVDKGFLKSTYFGAGYRWAGGETLGYAFKRNDANAIVGLDPAKPYKGPSEDHVDIWVGYSKKVTKDVNWRIQLNVRNVGESKHLVAFAMNPANEVKDMTPAYYRIAEGMTWMLTNTFEF